MSLLGIALGVAFFMAVSSLMRGSEQDFIKRLINSAPHITVSDEFRPPPRTTGHGSLFGGAVALRDLKPKTETRGIRGYKQKLAFIENLRGVRVAPVLSAGHPDLRRQRAGHHPERHRAGDDPASSRSTRSSSRARSMRCRQIRTASSSAAAWRKALSRHGRQHHRLLAQRRSRTMKIVGLSDRQRRTTTRVRPMSCSSAPRCCRAQGPGQRSSSSSTIPYAAREVAPRSRTTSATGRYPGRRPPRTSERAAHPQHHHVQRGPAILVVASFGIFNMISTVVMEKRRDIAILKSIGFHARDVRRSSWSGADRRRDRQRARPRSAWC